MEIAAVWGLVETVAAVDPSCRDRDQLRAAVAAGARLRAWLDGRDVQLAAQLAQVASFPEQAIAQAARSSLRDAGRILDRVRTAEAMPPLGDALAAGTVSGAHVDVIGRALRQLEPHQRPMLTARADRLVEVAAGGSPEDLSRAVAVELRRIQHDDAMARLERQRRATRLRSWVDGEGMWCLTGRFDPATGLALHSRLDATMAALYTDSVPDGCPSDPLERHGYLRAHALVALTHGRGGAGRPEVVVVVDTTTPDPADAPTIDWGLPIELPTPILHRLFAEADIHPVIVHRGVVLHAPGQLDLGRSTRLANRAQRRTLQALYPTCAIPGCTTRYQLCKLHHVHWWEHGGSTDLHNLLPLCVTHHHAVHHRHWQLNLTPNRQLTITYPDGTTNRTAPPRRADRRVPGPTGSASDDHHDKIATPLRM
ncbi:MAG TPA: DUF222 domain-containing protein [Acidimicrobiales bacterium]|nr:DUF222 domain-containing protein [Acidimicrobiales bacterium]